MLAHVEDDAVGRATGSVVGETTTTGVETTGNDVNVGTGILAETVAEPLTGPTLTDALPETVTPESDVGELVVFEALVVLEVVDETEGLAAEEPVLVGLVTLEIIDAIAVEDAVVGEAIPVDAALVSVVAIETGGVNVATGALVEEVEMGSETTDVGTAISVGGAGDNTDVMSVLVFAEVELDVVFEPVPAPSVGDVVVETAVGTSLLVDTAVGTSVDVVGAAVGVVGAAVGVVGAAVKTEVAVDESADVLVTVPEVLVPVTLEFCDTDDDVESEATAVEVATGVDEVLLDAAFDVVDADEDDACEDDDGAISVDEDDGALDVDTFVD